MLPGLTLLTTEIFVCQSLLYRQHLCLMYKRHLIFITEKILQYICWLSIQLTNLQVICSRQKLSHLLVEDEAALKVLQVPPQCSNLYIEHISKTCFKVSQEPKNMHTERSLRVPQLFEWHL